MKFLNRSKILKPSHGRILTFFVAGAFLELFMNYFHVGEANIYRSIEKNMSNSIAESRFELEKTVYEEILNDQEK